MATLIQRRFTGGEIAPAHYAGCDLVKYATGLRDMRNFFIMRSGGATNRGGTTFTCEVKDSSKTAILVPFVFNIAQTYLLEFGHQYMRVIQNGATIMAGSPAAWSAATAYAVGDLVSLGGTNYYCKAAHTNQTPPNASYWYAMPATGEFEMPTPYLEADLESLQYVQSADVITIVHKSYAPMELARYDHNKWTLSSISFTPSNTAPVAVNNGAAGSTTVYAVTAVKSETYEESLMTTTGGTSVVPSTSTPVTVTITHQAGATEYNIYKKAQAGTGVFGFIGTTPVPPGATPGALLYFSDAGIVPDTGETPPIERNPFSSDYPGTVAYIQQRLMLANTTLKPETIYGSRVGMFKNFTISSPGQDDDAITFTMAGRQVNEIKHLLDVGKLIVFTSSGEHGIQGGADGVLTPTQINPKQYSYNGASSLPPIVVNNTALYVQARGSTVRDLGYNYQTDGYTGNDLTVFSTHLFDGYQIVSWAYQKVPHSIVWAVRDDGTVIGLTYVREHEIIGWHRHDFKGGFVENVCTVPEGDEDAVYFIIRRTINGQTKRYIERMNSRRFDDIVDASFLDCSLSYDGRNTDPSSTMTISDGTTWEYDETLTLTSSAGIFVPGDVGNRIFVTGDDGAVVRITITGYTSVNVVQGVSDKTIPVSMRGAPNASWTRAVDTISGLSHLEGLDVSVFADGFVVANPHNESYTTVTVSGGSITLDKPYGVIRVGIPITSDLQTLDIDSAQSETQANKKKLITQVSMMVENSRGIWAGSADPGDDSLTGLTELKGRSTEGYEDPVALKTEVVQINIDGKWDSNGRVFIRQSDPLPLTVLSIVPSGSIETRG